MASDGGFSYNENKLVSFANKFYACHIHHLHPLSSPATVKLGVIYLEEGKPMVRTYGFKCPPHRGFNSAGK